MLNKFALFEVKDKVGGENEAKGNQKGPDTSLNQASDKNMSTQQ